MVSGTDGTTAHPVRLSVHHECCLENAPPSLLATLRAELTIDNPRYQDAKRFGRWIGKKLKPQLFFFREENGRFCCNQSQGGQSQAADLIHSRSGCCSLNEAFIAFTST